MIAALYVETGGTYFGIDGVDPWDAERDARLYRGPHPVVAHPPCQRWGSFWRGKMGSGTEKLGDDGGCFGQALYAVRTFGGVIEHPAGSQAWKWHGLASPGLIGWTRADGYEGWTCRVEQGSYGHKARKPTWLYSVGCELPELRWGDCGIRVDPARYGGDVAKASRVGSCALLSRKQRRATPSEFRDLLIGIARSAG